MRIHGWLLVAAAICFWTSWALMPGVGITDAATILTLVSAHRDRVLASTLLQLLSAALFALSIPGLAPRFSALNDRWGKAGVYLLAVGACGDAADAIYHQLAYEMVQPGVDRAAMLSVMQRMQSADLLYLLPMILAFLLSFAALSIGAARSKIVSKWNPALYAIAIVAAVVLARFGPAVGVSGRTTGLLFLGLLSTGMVWSGVALQRSRV